MLLLVLLAPALRSGGIILLESLTARYASRGQDSQISRYVYIQIEESPSNEYVAMDHVILSTRAAFLHKEPWSRIQEVLAMGPKEIVLRAFVRLCLLFLADPCIFGIFFYKAYSSMDDIQCIFALLLLIYECIFVLLIVVMVFRHPGLLFFDAVAQIRIGKLPLACIFIFSPDKILVAYEAADMLGKHGETMCGYHLMVLKLSGGLALLSGALARDLYPPLAGFYFFLCTTALWELVVTTCGKYPMVSAMREALACVITAAPRFWTLCSE